MKKIGIIIVILLVCFCILFNDKNKKTIEKTKSVSNQYDSELFHKYYPAADKILKNMTLEEKVGQLFLVRYDFNLADLEIEKYHPAGYIFFAKDFENEDRKSFSEKINNYQEKSKIPLTIAVDEEGGIVTRVSRYTQFREEKFLSPRTYYDQGGFSLLEDIEKEKANLLLSLGINLNLAPVADVSINQDDYIYERSFKDGPTLTSEFVKRVVNISNNLMISSCLKHFPGYGNNSDTHTGIAIDKRSYDNFLNNDYIPFEAGIKANVPTILVSHNIIEAIDDKYPASLSPKIHKELRKKLNFSGIIITDDLAMDAVNQYTSDNSAASLAVNASNDLIITSDFINMYNEVYENIKNKKIDIEKVNKAVRRIIAWKMFYKLF